MQKAHLHLIKWAISKGYTMEVWGDGEELDYSGDHYLLAKEAAEACDTADIILYKDGERAAWFYVVNWNIRPEEIISDYSANEVGDAWQRAYDEQCGEEICCNK